MITLKLWHAAVLGVLVGLGCFAVDQLMRPPERACTIQIVVAPGSIT